MINNRLLLLIMQISFAIALQFPSLCCLEYKANLDELIKCLMVETEPGYVLFGSKPVCYYVVRDTETTPLIGSSVHELESKLRLGLRYWLQLQPVQENDDYVLKITKRSDGYEILCLNKKTFLKAVQDNIALFQYILGPKVTPQLLFESLSKGKESFYTVLHDDNTLVGILLGFGTTNSILVGRSESFNSSHYVIPEPPISTTTLSKDYPLMWNRLIFSLLFNEKFEVQHSNDINNPGFGFSSREEEEDFLESLNEDSVSLYSYSPRLVYGSFQLDPNSQNLIKTYEEEQRHLISLIHSKDLSNQVIKRLGLKFLNPEAAIEIPELHANDLADLFRQHLKHRQLESIEGSIQGIEDADSGKEYRYKQGDYDDDDEYYKLMVLERLQDKIRFTENYFSDLSKNPAYISVNNFNIYVRILEGGSGEILDKNHSGGTFSFSIYLADSNSVIPHTSFLHKSLNLNQVIPGLSLGVQGMQPGELREILIHPEFGYGFFTKFEKWQPLKVLISLESIDKSSPPLVVLDKPLPVDRPLTLSMEEKAKLKEKLIALSYQEGRKFWDFYKNLKTEINKDQFIDQLKIRWNNSSGNEYKNLLALDLYSLKIWQTIHENERHRALEFFKKQTSAIPLINGKLYLDLKRKGTIPASWPLQISLVIKDLDGNILRQIDRKDLALDEFECWNQGLQLGLRNRNLNDKGVLFIHPDLSELSLFRNQLNNKTLVVEFDVLEWIEGA